MTAKDVVFPNYKQMPQHIPQPVWRVLRFLTISTGCLIIIASFVLPQAALDVFWRIIVPLLPILFIAAPGIWRNVCPMAALNQMPRWFKINRALNPPDWWKKNTYLIAMAIFLLIVPARKALFNTSGPALGLLLLFAFTAPLIGGYLLKGKSGWCSSICPLLPVQRLYGQTPLVNVPNNYCAPCVGCAKNCYDFNPHIANLADQYDSDQQYTSYRRIFAGAFPGLILAFYLIPDPPKINMISMYLQMAVFVLTSLGLFLVLDTFFKQSSFRITSLYGAVALNYYYWFNIPEMSDTIHQWFHISVPMWVIGSAYVTIFSISAVWMLKTFRKERIYLHQSTQRSLDFQANTVLISSVTTYSSELTGNPENTIQGRKISLPATSRR